MLGAGGAAKAIAYGLKRLGATVVVAGRTAQRAQQLADALKCKTVDWANRYSIQPDILVNCTPVGMHPNVDATPYDKHHLRPSMVVFDTVYNPGEHAVAQRRPQPELHGRDRRGDVRATGLSAIQGIHGARSAQRFDARRAEACDRSGEVLTKVSPMRFLLALLALSVAQERAFAEPYKVGDRIVVIHDGAPIVVENKTVGHVDIGRLYAVQRMDNGKLWVDSPTPGWIDPVHVLPLRQGLSHFSALIEIDPADTIAIWSRANVLMVDGLFDAAIADLTELIRLDPQSDANWNNRARALTIAGNHDAAISDYTEAIRRFPRSVYFEYRGNAEGRKADYSKAVYDWKAALVFSPHLIGPHQSLARLFARTPDKQFRNGLEAVKHATAACKISKWQDTRDIELLASANAEAGQFDEAIKWQAKANELFLQPSDRRRGETRLDLFRCHESEPVEDPSQARSYQISDRIVVIRAAPIISDRKTIKHALMGWVYNVEQVNGSSLLVDAKDSGWIERRYVLPFDEAAAYFTKSLELVPTFRDALRARGLLFMADGKLDSAIQDFSEVIRLDPSGSEFWNDRGRAWLMKGDSDKAISDHTEEIRLEPNKALAYCHRASAWEKKGNADKAIADCDDALRLHPKNAWAFNLRGFMWSKKRNHEKAIHDYTEAIGIDVRYGIAYLNRGNSLASQNKLDDAIKDFTQVSRLEPKNFWAYYNRGNALRRKGDIENALKDYEEAIRIHPMDPAGYNQLAWVLATCSEANVRNGAKAVEYAKQACELSGWKNGDYIDSLAAAYAESGDFQEAIKWQQNAIELGKKTQLTFNRPKRLELYKQDKPYRE